MKSWRRGWVEKGIPGTGAPIAGPPRPGQLEEAGAVGEARSRARNPGGGRGSRGGQTSQTRPPRVRHPKKSRPRPEPLPPPGSRPRLARRASAGRALSRSLFLRVTPVVPSASAAGAARWRAPPSPSRLLRGLRANGRRLRQERLGAFHQPPRSSSPPPPPLIPSGGLRPLLHLAARTLINPHLTLIVASPSAAQRASPTR